MSNPSQADEPMDVTVEMWDSAVILRKRKEFVDAGKTEVSAVSILQELVELKDEQVDRDAWVDCSSLLYLLLENITPSTLLLNHQIWLLAALQDKSANVVNVLANSLCGRREVTEFLADKAVAVAVAFARRLNHTETFEPIARLLAPVASNPLVLEELKHQHDQTDDVQHRFKVYQVVVEALRQEVYTERLQHFMDSIHEIMRGDDYIGKLCAFEMLTDCAVFNKTSCDILSNLSITKMIYDDYVLKHVDADLFHAAMVYLGALGRIQPQLLNRFDKVPVLISEKITSSESVTELTFMVDSLQHITVTESGKLHLQEAIGIESVDRMLKAMVTRTIFKSVEVLRDRVIAFFGSIMQEDDDSQCEPWFGFVSRQLCSLLTVSLAKSAEIERKHSLETLAVLLQKNWAVKEFMNMDKKQLDIFMDWVTEYTDPIFDHTVMKRQMLTRFVSSDICAQLVDPGLKERIVATLQPRAAFEPQLDTVNM